jgi:hypothetical protein
MADIKLSIDDLPPATTVYGADVFVIDQLGGDGYTKKITYNNLRTTLSDTFVLKAGDTMTGALILNTSTPVSALQATSKGYVDAQVVTKVSKAGDTMTGPLTLNSNAPTAALHAASRGYVQNNFIPISGIGTGEQNTGMTGFLTLCAHPVSAFHAATKFYVDNNTGDGSPVGSIVYFAASAAPIGWFACSGAALNTTIFQDLFNVIGYTFGGSGDTFNLPDLRGEFLRGWDSSRGIDAGRIFGSSQSDDFKSHTHTASLYRGRFYTNIGNGPNWSGDVYGNNQTWPYVQVDATGGTETRPRNIALLPCIKYATSAAVNYLGLSAQTLLNYVNSLGAQIPNPKSVAKAWVNFNGTTGTIRGSYNVSTITKFGSGRYQINFSPPLADTNYTVSALGGGSCNAYGMQDQTLTSVRVNVQRSDTDCGAYWDVDPMMVVIFGN